MSTRQSRKNDESRKASFQSIIENGWSKLEEKVKQCEAKVAAQDAKLLAVRADDILAAVERLREEVKAVDARQTRLVTMLDEHKVAVKTEFEAKVVDLIKKMDGIRGIVKAKTGIVADDGEVNLVADLPWLFDIVKTNDDKQGKLYILVANQDKQIADIERWLKAVDDNVASLKAQTAMLHDTVKAPEGEMVCDHCKDIAICDGVPSGGCDSKQPE